jgi:hypothetical protein
VANAEVAKAQDAQAAAPVTADAAAAATPAANAPASAAPVVTPPPTGHLTQRFFPTDRSVDEILKSNAAAAPPLDFQQRVDYTHDRIYAWTQGLVEATDHKFAAEDRELLPVPAAPFRIGMNLQSIDHSDGLDLLLDVDLDIALSLPNIEKRLRIPALWETIRACALVCVSRCTSSSISTSASSSTFHRWHSRR